MGRSGRVLIDVGHGYYDESKGARLDPGSMSAAGAWSEFHANLVAATVTASSLKQLGHEAVLLPFGLGLTARGLQATDYDVFLSIHHNAANASAQGTESVVGKGIATPADRELATTIARIVSEALGLRNRGVIELSLGVLSGARKTNVRAAVLSEGFFIDVPGIDIGSMARKEGQALASAINSHLVLTRQI